MLTDGFADQFGGQNGKKLMTKKFKEYLLSIQHIDIHDQEKHLLAFFNEWKGSYEQVDDVLVIGVKI